MILEFISLALLLVISAFLIWDVAERISSGIAVFLNPPADLPGTQLPGYVTGNVVAIILLALGIFGVIDRNIWWYTVAVASYLLGGLGESMAFSKKWTSKIAERGDSEVSSLVANENAARFRIFLVRLAYRYIFPVGLGYLWFALSS